MATTQYIQVLFGLLAATTEEIALKEMKSEHIGELDKEGKNMINLIHPHVVKFHGIYKEKMLIFVEKTIFLCTEYVSGGSLEDYLKKRWRENKSLNEEEMIKFGISACKGMKYLEE